MEEDRLTKATGKPYGSTRRGIAPIYADKYMKKAFRMGELLNTELLYKRLPDIVEWKNMTIKAYGRANGGILRGVRQAACGIRLRYGAVP